MSRPARLLPASIEEAEARIADAIRRIQHIDAQLTAERGERHPRAPTPPDKVKWRSDAIFAKQAITNELRQDKAWLKTQRKFAHEVAGGNAEHPDPTFALLARAYRVLKKLSCEVDIDPDEQAVVDDLQSFITHHMPPIEVP